MRVKPRVPLGLTVKFHKTFVPGIKFHITFCLKGKILGIIGLGGRHRETFDLREKFLVPLSTKNETSRKPWSYNETSENLSLNLHSRSEASLIPFFRSDKLLA
jgi:hypothetical protein